MNDITQEKIETNSNLSNAIAANFAAEIGDGKRHTIAIDAEWNSRIKLTIGYALVVDNKYKFVVLNEAIKDRSDVLPTIIERIENYCQSKEFILCWMPLNDDSCDATSIILRKYGIQKGGFDVLMFYSPKDLSISFGFENLKPYYNKKKITQKKRLAGKYFNEKLSYKICDLKGWTNKSLKGFAASVGVEMTSKDKMDDYKSHMLDGLIAKPETFLDYMVGDTTCLFEIREKFVQNIQWLQRDVINLPESAVFEFEKIPLTIGSIVAKTLERYIRYCLCPEHQWNSFEYALLKLGIIDCDAKDKREVTALHHELRQKITDSRALEDNLDEVIDLITKNCENEIKHKYKFEAFDQSSVRYFGRATKTSEAFLSLVQGGRCNNEQYWRYRLDYAADIDLKSAYASVLRRIEYPIGLPIITSFTPNEPRWTLEEWFKHSKVLKGTNRNWMVVVSGKLNSSQDLLYSKVTTQKKINKAVINATEDALGTHDHNDDAHIEGLFVLAQKELQNAIITADIWEAIVQTNKQKLNEYRNLEVVAAAYYRDQDRCTDINEWIDKVLADDCEYVTDKRAGGINDNRTRAWFSLPLEDVFGKIIDTRNQLKSEAKQANAEGKHEKYLKLNGRQEALKLFNNSGYGVLASPYFNIGNTVVANNITAQIRLAVWQMSKALNTCQSITDGGMYEPGKVNRLKTEVDSFRKPSLSTLSDLQTLQDHRYVEVVSLGDINWKPSIKELFREDLTDEEKKKLQKELAEKMDAIALQHIKDFWKVYGLEFQFEVEHKAENFAKRVAYWSKGDYALDPAVGERYYKIRGAKKNKDKDKKNHPKYELFDNILDDIDIFPKDLEYIFHCLLKVGKFKIIQDCKKGYQDYKTLQPGDDYEEDRKAQFNNTHMAVDTIKEYQKRAKRTKKEGKVLFEKQSSKGIKWVHAVMMMDNLFGRNS